MYADYRYYQEVYRGTMPEAHFNESETWSEAYIRYLTFLNGEIFAQESDGVKRAVCAAADIYYADKAARERRAAEGKPGVVKSENIDGYSVSYISEQQEGQTAEELLRKKAYDAVYMHLLPTGWLSRRLRRTHGYECGYHNL